MTATRLPIDPLISVRICSPNCVFHAGDLLRCEYQIDAVQPVEIQALEASVMWYTEGKGDEDLGVHCFERTTPSDSVDGDLRHLHRLETRLPRSPLSYNGVIVKIRWCVRVRLFWGRGKQAHQDRIFQLLPLQRADCANGRPAADSHDARDQESIATS
jgi:hypothetical protein